ncbi:MAG: ABC transporter permease [Pseudomonadota bacterium]|nr:ABC transporter permease [Pseudomonadota bacterium]QKK06417.1 MAG: ABC transporter permease [Pseudomonadota bacterium]
MNTVLVIGWEYLKNRRRQTVLSIVGVMLGVSFFIGIASMMKGMHDYFIEKLIDVAPHVKIMDEFRNPQQQPVYQRFPDAAVELRGIKPREEIRGIHSARSILERLTAMDGLAVSPVLQGQVFLRYGGKDVAAALTGIRPEMERHASNLERDMTQGDLNALLTNSNGIIIGEELAHKLGARLGAKISAISPAGNTRTMKLVGLFNTGVTEVDGSTGYAMLKKVQILQDRENRINQINIRLQNVDDATSLAADLEKRYGYRTESWQETFANIFEMFVIENIIMYSTVGVIIIVSSFGIFNIISTSVNEKSRDIAILKSIGFSEGDIRKVFLFQGIVIGLIGSIFGWVLGAMLVEMLASFRIDLGEEVNMPIKFEGMPVFRSVWLYIGGAVMATLSSVISAYIPARKAAALYPVDIIRGAA